MGELKEKMKKDMELRNFSKRTIVTYLGWMKQYTLHAFPGNLALWARSEPMALPGRLKRNRGGDAMNRAKSRVPWARISPIQAISLLPCKAYVFNTRHYLAFSRN
jgi:hypothetical protein